MGGQHRVDARLPVVGQRSGPAGRGVDVEVGDSPVAASTPSAKQLAVQPHPLGVGVDQQSSSAVSVWPSEHSARNRMWVSTVNIAAS